jgi:recombination protein RecA
MSTKLSKVVDQIIKKQPKIFGDIENSAKIKKCKIDSPQLSFLFGGGLPIGRIIRFRGPESSGKSIISNYCAAQLQKRVPEILDNPNKNKVIYVDFERSFDSKFASQVGIDTSTDKFIHLLPDDIETANDVVCELIKTDEIAAIVFDSDAAAPPRLMAIDPAGKANFGAAAKALGEFLKRVNILLANYNTTLFWISQERVNMTPMSHLPNCTGGESPKFFSSVVNRVTKTDVIKDANGTIGISIRVRNYKNKASIPFRDANMNLYYNGGFKCDEEYIDFLMLFDIIKQKGAYFYVPGEEKSIQGRVKLVEYLNSHLEKYDEWKKQVDELLTQEGKLDINKEEIGENYDSSDFSESDIEEDILKEEEE